MKLPAHLPPIAPSGRGSDAFRAATVGSGRYGCCGTSPHFRKVAVMCRVFLIVMGCCGMLAAQQSSKSNWSVQEVRVGTLHEIVTDMRTLTPDAGSTVVGVKALVRSAN